MKDALPFDLFVQDLRRTLRHLYDPDELGRSPLAGLLASGARDVPSSLKAALVAGIEALKPRTHVAPQSSAWRTYQILSARYIQQFQQSEVAATLGLGLRQMRRQESAALRVLAQHLWDHHGLRDRIAEQSTPPQSPSKPPSREEELEWLAGSLANEVMPVAELIDAPLKTALPLAQSLGVRLEQSIADGTPLLRVQPTTLRQALLNLLTVAIRCVPGGKVTIATGPHPEGAEIRMESASPAANPRGWAEEEMESIEMARRLVALSGGTLAIPDQTGKGVFEARLTLPAAEQTSVLVIDDNTDILQLLRRYLAGSHYVFQGTRDPEQALALAEKRIPAVIVLDVMLPGIDGWELLGRLREHPALRRTRIIVSTILPQEQLALTLGAAAFLRKPVSQESFLAALDQQLAQRPRGCE